jgi:hypothetical protein
MSPKKRKLITAKEAAVILKVSPEVITYLRQYEGLPFVKKSKYILFSEPEVIRWRNRQLTKNASPALDLQDYYAKIQLFKFITYAEFKTRVSGVAFLDGDTVLQYLKRQSPAKDIQDLVGDIVFEYWNNLAPKCISCGRVIYSSLPTSLCALCKKKKRSDSEEDE